MCNAQFAWFMLNIYVIDISIPSHTHTLTLIDTQDKYVHTHYITSHHITTPHVQGFLTNLEELSSAYKPDWGSDTTVVRIRPSSASHIWVLRHTQTRAQTHPYTLAQLLETSIARISTHTQTQQALE